MVHELHNFITSPSSSYNGHGCPHEHYYISENSTSTFLNVEQKTLLSQEMSDDRSIIEVDERYHDYSHTESIV